MLGSQTGTSTMEQWDIYEKPGVVRAQIYGNKIDEGALIMIRTPSGESYGLPPDESGDFTVHRKLIAKLLGTGDFHLVVRPIPY